MGGTRVTSVVAIVLGLAGSGFGIAGVVVLGRNRTIYPEPRPGSRLVRHGIYQHVRHPLYASVMLLAFAWGVAWTSPLALGGAGLLTLFLVLKSRDEEARLILRFPEYEDYRQHTARFLPWIY
jgi:protein-S-isoprenylcysteine O-methyltransferase Ste14